MVEVSHQMMAVRHVRPRRAGGWIVDAPVDADEVLATVRVLPGWVGLVVAAGGALVLWGGIFAGLRWALAR